MDQLAKVLGQLATQLGMTVNHLWPHVVLVTYFQSLVWLILDPIIFIIYTVIAIRAINLLIRDINELEKNPKSRDRQGNPETGAGFDQLMVLCLLCLWVVITVLIIANLPDVVAGVAEPEGMTVFRLLGK